MNKEELIKNIDGDFDYYKITFPKDKTGTTTKTTTYTATKTTTKGEDKEKEILNIIENNPSLNIKQIAQIVSLTEEGVKYHLKNLKNNGRIKREGSKKTGKWIINKE